MQTADFQGADRAYWVARANMRGSFFELDVLRSHYGTALRHDPNDEAARRGFVERKLGLMLPIVAMKESSLMQTLHLNLKAVYFDAIAAGEKREEYRLATPYWRRRLEGRQFGGIVLKKGYPKRGDSSRTLTRPWAGFTIKTITHPHFGPSPVQVFAITVN